MLRTVTTTSRCGPATVNVPSSLIVVPTVVPCTETCPVVMGSEESESTTRPVMMRVCPCACTAGKRNRDSATSLTRYFIDASSEEQDVMEAVNVCPVHQECKIKGNS